MPVYPLRQLWFIIACFLMWCPLALRADTNFKPWDKNAVDIQVALDYRIPQDFQPPRKMVWAETVSKAELRNIFKLIYPKQMKMVDSVDGLYLGRGGDDAPSNAPPLGSQIYLIGNKNMVGVFVHEYGHFVQSELLTKSEADEWLDIYVQHVFIGDLPSSYAYTNKGESFAECFRYWNVPTKGRDVPSDIVEFFTRVQKRLHVENTNRLILDSLLHHLQTPLSKPVAIHP